MMSVEEAMYTARHLQNEGKLEEAESILHSILKVHPSHAHALHLLGLIAYQVGKINLAVELIDEAIKHNPTVALFHSNLGEMYRKLKVIHLSIQYGQNAITLDPNSVNALSNLGIAYYDAKEYEQALNFHKRALAINPRFNCSLNNMGSIYKIQGKTKQAIEFYEAAIEASPHFVESYYNLGALFLHEQLFTQAIEYLTRAIHLLPTFVQAHCHLGLAWLGLEKCNNAISHFEKALQLNPDNDEVYYGFAKLHLYQHYYREAVHHVHKAISLNPQRIEYYQFLADIYRQQGQYTQALKTIEQAIKMDSTSAYSYLCKGNLFMEWGKTSQAEEEFAKIATNSDPNTRVLAHYSLVQLRKITEDNPSLKDLMCISLNNQALSPSKLEYVYFALGKCYDDMGEGAKAFEYFTEGCRLKRQRITFNIADQVQFTQNIIQCFTKQTVEYLQNFANPSALPIFIVGMPRSGGTLVEQIISSHPQVYGAGELKYLNDLILYPVKNNQKINYYPERISQLSSETWVAIAEKYLSYLRRFSQDAIRVTDKMPYNFLTIGVIHALFPNAKIIHVKRNPLDTCLSCYTKLFTEGQLYSYDLIELGQYYQCYEQIMAHWRQILPAHAWLDIEYESIVNYLEDEVKALITFCDLPWDPACLTFYQSKRQVRTASFLQIRQPVYKTSVERWRRYEQELSPLVNILSR